MNGSGGKDEADIIQYHTIIAQKDIRIEMRASSGVIRPEEENALQSIVESIVFTADFDTTPTDKTEAFLYQDPDMGVEFTVPENWVNKNLPVEVELPPNAAYAPFCLRTDLGMTLSYERTSLWDGLTGRAKFGTTRRDWDNSMVPASAVAKIFKVSPDRISIRSYGGKEYYSFQRTVNISAYGIDAECLETICVRFQNGYAFNFCLGGPGDQEYYQDFERLLNSVKYSDIPEPRFSAFTRRELIPKAVMTAVVIVICILLRRGNVKRRDGNTEGAGSAENGLPEKKNRD